MQPDRLRLSIFVNLWETRFCPPGIDQKSCQRAERSNIYFLSKKCQATRDANGDRRRAAFFFFESRMDGAPTKNKAESVMWSSISFTCQNLVVSWTAKRYEEQKANLALENGKFSRWCALVIKIISRENVFLNASLSQTRRIVASVISFSLEPYTQRFLLRNIVLCVPLHMPVLGSLCLPLFCASECKTRNLYVTQPVLSNTHSSMTRERNEK